MSFSDFLENKILDHVFRGATYTTPTTLYIGLCTSATSDSMTGSTIPELAFLYGYTRAAILESQWSVYSAVTGAVTNSAQINFPAASSNWATVSYFAICDASSAGNMLVHGILDLAKTVEAGDMARFAISSISIALN